MAVAIAVALWVAGCSFHSNQISALKNLLVETDVTTQSGWLLSGSAGTVLVYPIRYGEGILFTDGADILIHFDGWHFVEIIGYPERTSTLNSRMPDNIGFDYRPVGNREDRVQKKTSPSGRSFSPNGKNKLMYRVNCLGWISQTTLNGELLSQACSFDSKEVFSNSI